MFEVGSMAVWARRINLTPLDRKFEANRNIGRLKGRTTQKGRSEKEGRKTF